MGLGDAIIGTFVHKNDPNFHLSSLVKFGSTPGAITNFHTIVPRTEVDAARASARMGIGSHPELMDKLIKQNRKLLIWENLSDTTLSPFMAINYYRQAAKLYGGYSKLQNNVRLFGIPGTGHCSMNGIGPNNFDALTAMEEWVEKGKGPDALPAKMQFLSMGGRGSAAGGASAPSRTMPLCKYPEMAKYSGKGDVNDGANWSCPANDTRMLKVGESGRQAGVVE
jgi:feruloyl esterase